MFIQKNPDPVRSNFLRCWPLRLYCLMVDADRWMVLSLAWLRGKDKSCRSISVFRTCTSSSCRENKTKRSDEKKKKEASAECRRRSPMLAARSEKRLPYMLLARRKAPFSRMSSSMVAVCACSVLFMSCHESSASGRRRLSTVCTTACHHPQYILMCRVTHTHTHFLDNRQLPQETLNISKVPIPVPLTDSNSPNGTIFSSLRTF